MTHVSSFQFRIATTLFSFFFLDKTPTYTEQSLLPTFLRALHQSDTGLDDVIVRPHGWYLALERFKRELERRARVPDLELLQHARVQNTQPSYLQVLPVSAHRAHFERGPCRIGFLGHTYQRFGGSGAVVDRCGATGEKRRICICENS